jgi:hypothetical protein
MTMSMRAELPIGVLAADGRTGIAWDETLKDNTDLIVLSAFAVTGLTVSLILALASPLSEGLTAYLAYAS